MTPLAERSQHRPLVEVSELAIRYPRGDRAAIDDISFAIDEGDAALLVGPTGSGKSTLALTLNGIVPQSIAAEMRGTVRVAGLDSVDTPLARLCATTAIVFQDPESQSCLLRVDEEIAFGLENLGVARGEIGPRVGHALALLGAESLARRRLDQLSGGELQRVALAAALVIEPRLLVLDEPTAYLDPEGSRAFFRLLAAWRAQGKRTVLVIEHKVEEASASVSRALVLDGAGHLQADGPVAKALGDHATQLAMAGVWLPAGIELALAAGLNDAEGPPLSVRSALESAAVTRLLAAAGRRDAPHSRGEPGEVALSASRISLGYQVRPVVHECDLALRSGQLTALVGANGSGKSTLLLGLAGLLEPISGRLDGRPGAMIFQNPEHQFVARTVFSEIAHGLRARGDDEARVTHTVERTLDRFALQALRQRSPFSLSQGEKRRLSVAAMAVLDPSVLLLDEPTFGLDRRYAFALMDTLAAAARNGAAVCFVSHDLRLVAEYADRIVVLGAGRVRADGQPETVFANGPLLAQNSLLRPALVDWWLEHRELRLPEIMRAARLPTGP